VNTFQSWYGMQPRALRALWTINVVFYVAWLLVLGRIPVVAAFVLDHFALHPALSDLLYEPWQLLTYNFIHLGLDFGGFLHILFNMLWLVWIGREFEEMQGSHRLLALYLISGIGGGLLSVFFYNVVSPGNPIIHGASAAVFGVMTAVATFYPYQSIGLLFIGTVRLVYVVIGLLVIDILFRMGGGTAVTAHIGGALFGFLFAKAEKGGIDLSSWARIFFGHRRSRHVVPRRTSAVRQQPAGIFGKVEGWFGSTKTGEAERPARTSSTRVHTEAEPTLRPSRDSVQIEVDRILDKISASGYESLSDEEKRVLYEASRR